MARVLPRIELSGKTPADRPEGDSEKCEPQETGGPARAGHNSKSLVIRLNRKLASEGKAVVKNHRKNASVPGHEYRLLDTRMGTVRYLSLSDVEHMARELPVTS